MAASQVTNKEVLSDALGRKPELSVGFEGSGWVLSRWRHFIDEYEQDALSTPTYCVHLSGKQDVRHWAGAGWSPNFSSPGFASTIPASQPMRIRVNGELDVATLWRRGAPADAEGSAPWPLSFGISDPLGVMLTRQILSEAYRQPKGVITGYMQALMNALDAHLDHLRTPARPMHVPTAAISARRIHAVIDHIEAAPERDHSLAQLAEIAGVSPPHFCRMFKRATGLAPRQYVNKARIARARLLLESTDTPIALIALRLGFTNQSHFNRLFRALNGITPGACRAKRGDTTVQ